MKTNFLKTAYAALVALIVTFQLVAVPLALTAGATDQVDVAFGECEGEFCGGG